MDRSTIEQTVRDIYAARDAADLDGLMRHMGEDATFRMVGAPDVKADGKEPLRALLQGLIDAYAFTGRHLASLVIDGERAAAHSRVTVQHRPSGLTEETDVLDLFTFRNGRCVGLTEWADLGLISRMMAAPPAEPARQ